MPDRDTSTQTNKMLKGSNMMVNGKIGYSITGIRCQKDLFENL